MQDWIIFRFYFFIISDLKFSSSGREDVDVRMLGLGRPFLFELVNPRKVYFSKEEMAKKTYF